MQKYINNPDFTKESIGKVSTACGGLCSWVLAMDVYHNVAKTIVPKRVALAKAEEEKAAAHASENP